MPATARSHRADLDALIRHPEMVALIAAAPSTVIPPLRSLERNSTSVTRQLV
jgi:hypothetical protein